MTEYWLKESLCYYMEHMMYLAFFMRLLQPASNSYTIDIYKMTIHICYLGDGPNGGMIHEVERNTN
jgi:hypothetical protein